MKKQPVAKKSIVRKSFPALFQKTVAPKVGEVGVFLFHNGDICYRKLHALGKDSFDVEMPSGVNFRYKANELRLVVSESAFLELGV
jgi:hypothetical protein